MLLWVLSTVAGSKHYCCSDDDLNPNQEKPLLDAGKACARTIILSLLERYKNPYKVPEKFCLDLFSYPRRGEMNLARYLRDVRNDHLAAWRIGDESKLDVSNDTYISNCIQFKAEFQYV